MSLGVVSEETAPKAIVLDEITEGMSADREDRGPCQGQGSGRGRAYHGDQGASGEAGGEWVFPGGGRGPWRHRLSRVRSWPHVPEHYLHGSPMPDTQ